MNETNNRSFTIKYDMLGKTRTFEVSEQSLQNAFGNALRKRGLSILN